MNRIGNEKNSNPKALRLNQHKQPHGDLVLFTAYLTSHNLQGSLRESPVVPSPPFCGQRPAGPREAVLPAPSEEGRLRPWKTALAAGMPSSGVEVGSARAAELSGRCAGPPVSGPRRTFEAGWGAGPSGQGLLRADLVVHGHAELGRVVGVRASPSAGRRQVDGERLARPRGGFWNSSGRSPGGRAVPGLPLFAVRVWGAHPALSPHGGSGPGYTVLGHRHAHLELGKQTLPDVKHISPAESREGEVYEGQTPQAKG